MSYWTEHGGLNMHPEIDSENHPLFRAYYEWWCLQNNGPACTYDTIRDFFDKTNWMPQWYQANIPQAGDHFSRDNMWALMKYFLCDELPTLEDVEAFKYYVTNGYRWDIPDNPILLEIEKYERT